MLLCAITPVVLCHGNTLLPVSTTHLEGEEEDLSGYEEAAEQEEEEGEDEMVEEGATATERLPSTGDRVVRRGEIAGDCSSPEAAFAFGGDSPISMHELPSSVGILCILCFSTLYNC